MSFECPKSDILGVCREPTLPSALTRQIKSIQEAPTQLSKEELQAYLDLLDFYHSLLSNKSLCISYYRNLHSGNGLRVHDEAFAATKALLVSNPFLTHYDPNKQLVLTCDASQYGIGAVLSQLKTMGKKF
ncbi:hypothetical protein PR048_022641 [Dryococelus australis]|uniref:Reverse transcriptase/retrotransposon-derived protein RNase H-like domain-containing protein n=1 Tax=Dryococelus australis TaxID=614101 RepID=A0ABQ9H1I1_9NEOP|nr:hypothetical protein PR048_022641 [Dryococelus australis]